MVTYETLETDRQQFYANLIQNEVNKYPDVYYDRIKLRNIVIVKSLKFNNVDRGAVPDNYRGILFLGIRNDYSDDYIRHIFHHEQHHYAEFSIWNDYRYNWEEWRRLFTGRGGGGESAYINGEDNNAILYNPNLTGFINSYSTMGQEEDRAEMVAFFMVENNNRLFIEKAKRDAIFHQKSILLFKLFEERLDFPDLLQMFLTKVFE
jgi:hypothetical protein